MENILLKQFVLVGVLRHCITANLAVLRYLVTVAFGFTLQSGTSYAPRHINLTSLSGVEKSQQHPIAHMVTIRILTIRNVA